MAEIHVIGGAGETLDRPAVRTLTFHDLGDALRKGWDDFSEMPSHAIFLCLIYPLVGIFLIGLAFAYWQLASLDPNTPDTTIAAVLALRGASQGMMMLPLMTVAMDRIAPARMSRATVLATVIRQIAGAFGAASAASLLLMRQQHHQATLIQTVTPDAPAVASSLGALTVRLLEQGVAAGNAATMALGT